MILGSVLLFDQKFCGLQVLIIGGYHLNRVEKVREDLHRWISAEPSETEILSIPNLRCWPNLHLSSGTVFHVS